MAAVTISVEPEELLSLRTLAELDGVPNGHRPDVAAMAATLVRRALAASLHERGLAGPAPLQAGRSLAAGTAVPDDAMPAPRPRSHVEVRR